MIEGHQSVAPAGERNRCGRRRRLDKDLTAIIVLGAILVVALATFFVTDALEDRELALREAVNQERQHALFLAGHIEALALLAGHMAADISAEVGPRLDLALSEATALNPGLVDGRIVKHVLVFDGTGQLRARYPAATGDPAVDCSHCPFFVQLQQSGHDSVLGPVSVRLPGIQSRLGVARRLSKADGSFGGMVLLVLDLGTWLHEFGGDSLSVVLFAPDRTMVAAFSPSGSAEAPSGFPDLSSFQLDGTQATLVTGDKVVAIQRLKNFPLWIGIANSLVAVNEDTTTDLWIAGLLTAAATGVIGVFCISIGLQIRRRRRAERSLAEARDGLERRVEERTAELQREIRERKAIEAALRTTETRFQRFMENTPTGAHIVDEDGRFVFVNRRLAEWLGIAPYDALGKTCWDTLPEGVAAQWEEHDLAALDANGVVSRELTLRLNGAERVWLADKFPLSIEPGIRLLGGVITDISAHRAAERDLHHAHKMEALGQLTSGVAHDINNLLTIILGNLELVEDLTPGECAVRQHAREAQWAARRGAHLTDRLLAMSRRRQSVAELADANSVVGSMSELLRRTLGKEIGTTITRASDAPLITVDINRLENAVLNLCLNARDAMPHGGELVIEVAIRTFPAPPLAGLAAGSYVLLSVIDTGTGMAQDVIDRACDPFFTTKGSGKGTRLGLSMVKGFVTENGGSLTIQSRLGEGTTVTMYFPSAAPIPQPHSSTFLGPDPQSVTIGKVLVVEDEEDVRRFAVGSLERLGHGVRQAENARDAIAMLEVAPDIEMVFSDIVMPGGMNGVELAHEIRRRWPHVRILLTSGYPGDALDDHGDSGFPILRKPYDRRALSQAMAIAWSGAAERPHATEMDEANM